MPYLGLLIGLLFWVPVSWTEGFTSAVQLSVKSQYLGSLGSAVDDNAVLQPYLEINHDSGWHGYLWLNIPLSDGNPNRALEIEPSIGYRHQLSGWNWDWTLTLFDIQNPGVFDFSGDVLGPKLTLSRRNWYLQYLHYVADAAENGQLIGGGRNWQLGRDLKIESSLSYVDGPFHFEPIVYGKMKAIWSLPKYGVDLFVEALDILQEQDRDESRGGQIAVGISFNY